MTATSLLFVGVPCGVYLLVMLVLSLVEDRRAERAKREDAQ